MALLDEAMIPAAQTFNVGGGMRKFAILALLLVCVTASAGDASRRDGNDWVAWPEAAKAVYLSGVFDGIPLGNNLTIWGNSEAQAHVDSKTWAVTVDSYRNLVNEYFSHVSGSQLAAGLDDFYKDYRNRSIEINNAIWIVVNEIAGMSKADIEKMIENYRRNAK